ncbi:hypothetical protein NMY22_g3015 [Coprinellus aureogranulatus]|nr:hypothetical protein NMY22_g3015 [Coprinellus aureogranulatus]
MNGSAVSGKPVKAALSHGYAPVLNAFSAPSLAKVGFNIFQALVVDVLHEYEIGVFKDLFKHLIRVLNASGPGEILRHELDRRYRATPTFNRTIRKFSANASQCSRRAASDFEDLLQVCSIPAFDGLLPDPLNDLVLSLLYVNGRWHALAKLRMHTEATIILLEETTAQMGDLFRLFLKETAPITTVETTAEAEKRGRKNSKKHKDSTATTLGTNSAPVQPPSAADGAQNATVGPSEGTRGGGMPRGCDRGTGRGGGRGAGRGFILVLSPDAVNADDDLPGQYVSVPRPVSALGQNPPEVASHASRTVHVDPLLTACLEHVATLKASCGVQTTPPSSSTPDKAAVSPPTDHGVPAPPSVAAPVSSNPISLCDLPAPSVPVPGFHPLGPNTPPPAPLNAMFCSLGGKHYYCITKGVRVGVFSGWQNTSPYVTGVGGASYSRHRTAHAAYEAYWDAFGHGFVNYT